MCPPNKRYDLMDANKKVDLDHMQSLQLLHPYHGFIWHSTLKEDRSKYKLKFMLDKKELNLTLADFRTIFHLPQATDNNHNSFVPSILQTSIRIYNRAEDTIKFQDNWSSAAMANVMQDILQMLENTCHWMGSTAITDNANVSLLCQQHSCRLCGVTLGRTLLFASSSYIFDPISKIYKDHCQSLHDYLS
ncbi:hypothetical protein Tco_0253786 [Tanacetum coccineum]